MNAPVGIGIIGGGMIAQIAHLPFYLTDDRCDVRCVAEERPSLKTVLADTIGRQKVVEDHEVLLSDPEISAVIVSAPRPATGSLTLACLQAGKHVLAEKPMAHTADQARRLVAAANANGLVYAVGYMKRFDPGVEAAKSLFEKFIEDGRLGPLLSARFYDYSKSYAVPPPSHTRPQESRKKRFNSWPTAPAWLPEDLDDDYAWFMNAGSHDVNLLNWFFPEGVSLISAFSSGKGAVTATFKGRGCPIHLEVTKTEAGRWLEGAEFLFERGRLAVSIPSPMSVGEVSQIVVDDLSAEGTEIIRPETAGWSFERQAHGFLDVLTNGTPPRTSGADGLADLELIEAMWKNIVSKS